MKIAFVGDLALIGKYDLTKSPDAIERLKELSNKLNSYDYVVGNLESPLTDVHKTLVCKSIHLRSSRKNIELLKYLNIDAVSLANNHIFDYGKKGLHETIKTLENNGIEYFGIDKKFLLKEIQGEKISISGFCCYSTNGAGYIKNNNHKGINPLTFDAIRKQILLDKKNQAFSIFSFHWGLEHTNYPSFEHISLAKKIASIGDVIIVGHHPHVIQGVQKINNSFIAYSLGNFLFDETKSITGAFTLKQLEENKKSFILGIEIINGTITNIQYQGFKEDQNNGFEFFDIKNEIDKISKPLKGESLGKAYVEMRREQINKTRRLKFGKRDLKWFISR